MTDARWLSAKSLAEYLGIPCDRVRRLRRAGKIPEPSYHLGERSARWLSSDIEGVMRGASERAIMEKIVAEAIQRIRAEGEAKQKRRERSREQ
jgi:predicted DNA-binding transcriptional regulator AlpA